MAYILDLRKELGHRPLIMAAAAVLIINENNEILLQHRADNQLWGYPGGSMELGESFEECAIREVQEETGLICDELEFFTLESGAKTHCFYPNGDEIYVAGVIYICRKYHGEMKVQEEEASEQRFFSKEDLPDNIDPINVEIIHQAFESMSSSCTL